MANALEIFKQQAGMVLPAELQDAFNAKANVKERVTVPTLSPGGRKWTVSVDGKQTVLMSRTADGDSVEASSIYAVVLDYNAGRSRSYYAKNFDPDAVSKPDCWSNDGEHPDPSVELPQATGCKSCPMAVKGSKVDDRGNQTVACSSQKFLAVLLIGKTQDGWSILKYPPLRLKLAITSIWDNQSPDLQKEGWFAWDNFVNFLRSTPCRNTAQVVLRIKFDPNVTYPKVIFNPAAVITDAAFAKRIIGVQTEQEDAIKALLSRSWTPDGADGTPTDEAEEAPPLPKPVEQPKAPAPKAAPKAKKPEPAPEPEVLEGEIIEPEEAPAPKATKKAAKVVTPVEVTEDLEELVGGWE